MSIERQFPGFTLGDKEMLVAWLDFHRATLEMKCEGLDADRLKIRSVPASTLTLLGLLRHMGGVEQGWFRIIFEGRSDLPPLYEAGDDEDSDFNDLGSHSLDEVMAIWREECDHARGVVADNDLDTLSKGRTRRTGEQVSLRWIVTHMIEEYARHNGHADLLRESIDGATGM